MNNNKMKQHNVNESALENPYAALASLEDRLKVIANLVVDRMIEEQQNGSLRTETQSK